jgi:hypothetical protein
MYYKFTGNKEIAEELGIKDISKIEEDGLFTCHSYWTEPTSVDPNNYVPCDLSV